MPIFRKTTRATASLSTRARRASEQRWRDNLRGTLFQKYLPDG